MNIEIFQLLEGARKAEGLTVIIDVFRAFSTACYAFENGVAKIYPVGDIGQAYRMKEKNPEYILMGERFEKKPEGFDFGNSPSHLLNVDFSGKTIVHTTSSGTQGIENALKAGEIITGSFVNAGAIIRYIQKQEPEKVSLVCMGCRCEYPTDEDTFLAEYIRDELLGIPTNFSQLTEQLKAGSGARFFAPGNQEWSPESDFGLCIELNRFNFVLKVEKEKGLNYLKKVEL
ncbi:MAG: 2-phosphosulfolactate phosphatase [Prolixibacteraceae bacterium]|nr:2-phosphosulfolactate phosphatase [Prolixibacteraceae bacterium]